MNNCINSILLGHLSINHTVVEKESDDKEKIQDEVVRKDNKK